MLRIQPPCEKVCCLPPLSGAGQDVGRSCVVVHIGGKTVMFDCGMHMGYHDERKCDTLKTPFLALACSG